MTNNKKEIGIENKETSLHESQQHLANGNHKAIKESINVDALTERIYQRELLNAKDRIKLIIMKKSKGTATFEELSEIDGLLSILNKDKERNLIQNQ